MKRLIFSHIYVIDATLLLAWRKKVEGKEVDWKYSKIYDFMAGCRTAFSYANTFINECFIDLLKKSVKDMGSLNCHLVTNSFLETRQECRKMQILAESVAFVCLFLVARMYMINVLLIMKVNEYCVRSTFNICRSFRALKTITELSPRRKIYQLWVHVGKKIY